MHNMPAVPAVKKEKAARVKQVAKKWGERAAIDAQTRPPKKEKAAPAPKKEKKEEPSEETTGEKKGTEKNSGDSEKPGEKPTE